MDCQGLRRNTRHQELRRLACTALASLALFAVCTQPGFAQRTGGDRNAGFVDDVIRNLVESELERRRSDLVSGSTPREPAALAPRTSTALRQALSGFATAASRLTISLSDELDQVAGIRPLMSDVLKIRARSAVLAQRMGDDSTLLADFENLDNDWSVLSYRLRRLRGLSQSSLDDIAAMDRYQRDVSRLLEMKPQVDRWNLIRQTAALSADLRNLLEDIELQSQSSDERNELLLKGRRVQQQVALLSNTIADEGDYDAIVDEYKEFQTIWDPFAHEIRSLDDRYVERSVRRIRHVQHEMHELLRLPQGIDREQLLHVTNLLMDEVDEFFTRAPLKLLIQLPDSDQVLPTADQFYGVCQHFADCVTRNEDMATLVEDYRYIDQGWNEFAGVFRQVKSNAAQSVLNEIEKNIHGLRELLLIEESFDRQVAVELAAALDTLAGHFNDDLGLFLSRSFDVRLRTEVLRDATDFADAARNVHERLVKDAPVEEVRSEFDRLFESWRRVHGHLDRFEPNDKLHLERLAMRITPAVVDLRTMLAP